MYFSLTLCSVCEEKIVLCTKFLFYFCSYVCTVHCKGISNADNLEALAPRNFTVDTGGAAIKVDTSGDAGLSIPNFKKRHLKEDGRRRYFQTTLGHVLALKPPPDGLS